MNLKSILEIFKHRILKQCVVCGSSIDSDIPRITCSVSCHEEFIELMEKELGKDKKVVDSETQIIYRVPLRDIIEKGIKQEDLHKYPVWKEIIQSS